MNIIRTTFAMPGRVQLGVTDWPMSRGRRTAASIDDAGLVAAPERRISAHLAHSRAPRRRSAFLSHSRRSAGATGTRLRAPIGGRATCYGAENRECVARLA